MSQAAALKEYLSHLGISVRVLAVEGDSTDDTRDSLVSASRKYRLDLTLDTCNHGGPVYGSTEQPERMAALSRVCNAIFDGVLPSDNVLLYVESDLIWQPATIGLLLDHVIHDQEFDVFSPMVMAGENFYDVWAFRDLEGNRFGPFPPFHHLIPTLSDNRILEVSSVGSCLMMSAAVARVDDVRVTNDNALVGWCQTARKAGYRIAVATDLEVRHPA